MLHTFAVSLYENPGDRRRLMFYCLAEDEAHAVEQAENAYPAATILAAVLLPREFGE